MYLPVPSQPTCARAWASAAAALVTAGGEAFNVVIDVEQPTAYDALDNEVISLVDRFLRDHNENPIITVANTIFPQSLRNGYDPPEFYDIYLRDYDRLTHTRRWGRYFERMIRHSLPNGKTYNPLDQLIGKIRKQKKSGRVFTSTHELAIYDTARDGRYQRGGQCLSYLSFKIHRERGLLLTALYRNHTYIARCLGNLIGLGRLQAFIAAETALSVGTLTCISTHAEVDTGNWGVQEARRLVAACSEVFRSRHVIPEET